MWSCLTEPGHSLISGVQRLQVSPATSLLVPLTSLTQVRGDGMCESRRSTCLREYRKTLCLLMSIRQETSCLLALHKSPHFF